MAATSLRYALLLASLATHAAFQSARTIVRTHASARQRLTIRATEEQASGEGWDESVQGHVRADNRLRKNYRTPAYFLRSPAVKHLPWPQVFVVQGDLRLISADAVLYPTRKIDNPKWFPDGPPAGARAVDYGRFTNEKRVLLAPGTLPDDPEVWLSWSYWDPYRGTPPIEWFTTAAESFLTQAHARLVEQGRAPLCERQLPLLALPVLGTGSSGAKPIAGALLSALLLLLLRFAADHPVDIVLVTKSDQAFSAAQSVRARLTPLNALTAASYSACLSPRLRLAADRLAQLATSGQLVLFLGSVRIPLLFSPCL